MSAKDFATVNVTCFASHTATAAESVGEITVRELYRKLQTPYHDDAITLNDFLALTRISNKLPENEQRRLKAEGRKKQTEHKALAGAYMLGRYQNDSRKAPVAVEYRSALAIDCDTLPEQGRKGDTSDIWREIQTRLATLGCSYFIHETRKSTHKFPRLRIIIPLDRNCSGDVYAALVRAIGANVLKPEWVDPSSDEATRLMFWPTVSAEQGYRYEGDITAELPPLDVDKAIDNYFDDWTQIDKWPQLGPEAGKAVAGHHSRQTTREIARGRALQADPFEKPGIIGAFCRKFPIDECIDEFLSGKPVAEAQKKIVKRDYYPRVYEPACGTRYTYCGPDTSTVAGAETYEDFRFLYSFHATDPYHRELMSSWNLVQRHLFGHLDAAADPEAADNQLPSFKMMMKFAYSIDGLQVDAFAHDLVAEDQAEEAPEAVDPATGEVIEETVQEAEKPEAADQVKNLLGRLEWVTDQHGRRKIKSTINNFLTIFRYDTNLAGRIRFNQFSQRIEVRGRLPRIDRDDAGKTRVTCDGPRETPVLRDADEAALRNYLERRYQLGAADKFSAALTLAAEYNKFHPVKDYLNSLPEWDGVERVASLLPDYLGAEHSPFVYEVTTKHMLAAVTRVFHPGTKYDGLLVLSGRQGLGKSAFIQRLAGTEWFTDNVGDLSKTDSVMEMQGHIFIEFSELDALRKSEVTQIKSFVSRQDDSYRAPYGRNVESHPRQCVFWGTTNRREYLRDATGNRRFVCIDCLSDPKAPRPPKSPFADLPAERDQIWAEVMELYRKNEEMYWHGDGLTYSKETAEVLACIAEGHRDADAREQLVITYCSRQIPVDWETWNDQDRKDFYSGNRSRYGFSREARDLKPRQYVCAMGVWIEALGGDRSRFPKQERSMITDILDSLPWLKRQQYRDDRYGKPRGWKIIEQPDNDNLDELLS